jgi:hypothetical protein
MNLVGYIRHTKSRSASRQRAALEAAGIERIYTEGFQAETLKEAIRILRPGDRLVVCTPGYSPSRSSRPPTDQATRSSTLRRQSRSRAHSFASSIHPATARPNVTTWRALR